MWEVSRAAPAVGEGWEAVTEPLGIKPLRGPTNRGRKNREKTKRTEGDRNRNGSN